MEYHLKNNVRTSIAVCILMLFFVGLLFSRAILSIATVCLVPLLFIQIKQFSIPKKQVIATVLLLWPVLLSGFWSNDLTAWWRSLEVKLSFPMIFFFLLTASFSFQTLKTLIWGLTIVILLSTCYSIQYYFSHKSMIDEHYLMAKVMPVSMDSDHIRYSWLIVVNCILLIWQTSLQSTRLEKWFTAITLVFLIGYLHFLAAKTGLVCLYAGIFVWLCFSIRKYAWYIHLAIIATFVSIGCLAYKTMPSLQNRISYVLYDFSHYSKGDFMQGSSDGARVLSIKAGICITQQHWLAGVGFGDVETAIQSWHNQYHPSSLSYERFLPTNQWLIYSAGSGLIGLSLFMLGMLFLLQPLCHRHAYSVAMIVVVLLPLCTDDSFEGQYGACIMALGIGMAICLKQTAAANATI